MKTGFLARIKSWILSHPAMVVCLLCLLVIISLNFLIPLNRNPSTPAAELEASYPGN